MSNRDDRKARAEARVERARAREAAARAAYDNQPAHRIPLGQPILLGHHSQRRHERDLERLHRADQRRWQAADAARTAEQRATASGYAIQVGDDDAVTALRDKLAAAEAEHAAYLAHNKAARTAPCALDDCPGCQRLRRSPGHTPADRLPSYVLTNSRGRIKQIREQLAKAETHAAALAAGTDDQDLASGAGWTLTHAVADARVRFMFDDRPDPATRTLLKAHGFRWAPSVGAWQRHDTANGLAVARHLATRL